MSTPILMPKLGFSMNEGTLSRWLVTEGTTIRQGQPLWELESDKAVNEIDSPATGMLKIIARPGAVYAVGTVLGEIL
jgi:pyruvate/2-oxoglutarate dehydrogenase complex dihydrolipoamide acyltransferase (E2) component